MESLFITATPDSGESGSTTVTVTASDNPTESPNKTILFVSGGGMTRTVDISQAKGVVTWNYHLLVIPMRLDFSASGETKSVTVTSYRKKVINGVETKIINGDTKPNKEDVNWTSTVSGTGFSISGAYVTATPNKSTTARVGTATFVQTGSGGATKTITLYQYATLYSISSTKINITGLGGGRGTVSVVAPKNASWSIEFESNAYGLTANPAHGTGPSSVTIVGLNTRYLTGEFEYKMYLKDGSTIFDTATVVVRVASSNSL